MLKICDCKIYNLFFLITLLISKKIIIIKKVEANYVCKFNFRYYEMKKGKQIIIKIFLSFLVFVGKI